MLFILIVHILIVSRQAALAHCCEDRARKVRLNQVMRGEKLESAPEHEG